MLLVTDDLSSWNKILWLYLHESWATDEQQHSPFFCCYCFHLLHLSSTRLSFMGTGEREQV
jgi:hypothetical protein